MSEFLRNYLTVAIFVVVAVACSRFSWAREPPAAQSALRAEVHHLRDRASIRWATGWSQSQIRYYVFALLFVMFDVEAVFIFPWATRLEAYGGFGLVEMVIFIAILALGLVYAWRKGVLRWV